MIVDISGALAIDTTWRYPQNCVAPVRGDFMAVNSFGISQRDYQLMVALLETNISPENGGPLEKEIPIGNHHF